MKTRFLILVLAILILSACQAAPDPVVVAATAAAQTAAAASPTPLPTETPVPPTATHTAIPPTATNTPVPPTATKTPVPPTETAIPGPFTFKDDFSKKDVETWAKCEKCEWREGQLILGPFEPGSNAGESLNFVLCATCGQRIYYRMAVDVTFVDGQVDRYFGIVGPVTQEHIYYAGLSPWQFFTVRDYDFKAQIVKNLKSAENSLVKASKATNHFEVVVKPASSKGSVDIFFSLNGQSIYVVYDKPATESFVGLGMSFHSVAVAYDNFEYEELEWNK
jgi:hypothetical protein